MLAEKIKFNSNQIADQDGHSSRQSAQQTPWATPQDSSRSSTGSQKGAAEPPLVCLCLQARFVLKPRWDSVRSGRALRRRPPERVSAFRKLVVLRGRMVQSPRLARSPWGTWL